MTQETKIPTERAGGSSFFLVLLFFSGFASLIYEVVWTRVLLSVFGATVYASGTVLTTFMLGLALGSWLAARFARRIRLSPMRLYGSLELVIGLYALVFPVLLSWVNSTFLAAFGRWGGSFFTLSLVRFVLALGVLVLPATLMGATLPVITMRGVNSIGSLGRDLGRLYAVNTIGAAMGTFITGYFFIELLGIRKTTLLAAAINLLVFAGAWYLGRSRVNQTTVSEPSEESKSISGKDKTNATAKGKPSSTSSSHPLRRLLLLVLFISGTCALAYEVLWSRILVYVMGNFVHSFALMLTTFLIGIALGGWLLGRVADRVARPGLWLAGCQAVIGISALLMMPGFGRVLVWRDSVLAALSPVTSLSTYHDPWWQFTAWKVAAGLLLMIVPTFCMGASFPLATRMYVARLDRVVRGVGNLYAGNTLGGILGAFAASFLLIPAIGVRNSLIAFAALNLAAAVSVAAWRAKEWSVPRLLAWSGAAAVAIIVAIMALPTTIFNPIYASTEKGKALIYVREAAAGTVTVHETPNGFRVIALNGLNVAGTKFGFHCTQKLQAHFPLLMHPHPRKIMQIGFGTGGTCWSTLQHPSVEKVDCVEINPAVLKAAPFFEQINHGIYRPGADPRVTINIEDARNFVATTHTKYDVILSDSIHPRFTGNGLLYTKEYYALCAKALAKGGIISTWLPTGFLGVGEYKTIVRTMQSQFPYILLWYMNNTIEGYTILMGSRQPFAVDVDSLETRLAYPAIKADLAVVHMENVFDVLDCVVMGGANVSRYLGEGPLNTEDKPIIEFQAPRNMSRVVTEYRNLHEILRYHNFPEHILLNGWSRDLTQAAARRDTMGRYFVATNRVLEAQQAHLLGLYDKEKRLLREAERINPLDRDAPYLLHREDTILKTGRDPEW